MPCNIVLVSAMYQHESAICPRPLEPPSHLPPHSICFISVQFSSVAQSCPTLCDPMNCSMPGLPVHHQLRSSLKLTFIELVMPSSHLILCHPLFLLPPIPPSSRVFSNESTFHMRWPKYWSFSFNIIPSKEHPGLISFRMDWLDLLAVQGTLKSLLHISVQSLSRVQLFATHESQHARPPCPSPTPRGHSDSRPLSW